MKSKDRELLHTTSTAARQALALTGRGGDYQNLCNMHAETLIGGGSFVDPRDGRTPRHALSIVETGSNRVALIGLPFLAHAVALDPNDATRAVVFEKIGPGCADIDLARGCVRALIPPAAGRWYYGHGTFSADGSMIYATETVLNDGTGVIGVRDAKTLALIGAFPSHGDNPHDCRLIDGGRTMVVTNGGGDQASGRTPSVCFIDVPTQQLVKRLTLDDARFNAGHFDLYDDRGLILVSAPRAGKPTTDLGGISIALGDDAVLAARRTPNEIVTRMSGEALSVAIHPHSGRALVTHPGGGMVTMWDRSGAYVSHRNLARARGVSLGRSAESFLVSWGEEANLERFDAQDLSPVPGTRLQRTFLSGSHLFCWQTMRANAAS